MRFSFTGRMIGVASFALTMLFIAVTISHAQGQGVGNQTQMGTMGGGMTDQLTYGNFGAQVARDEDAAYKAFLKESAPVKKIQRTQISNWPKPRPTPSTPSTFSPKSPSQPA